MNIKKIFVSILTAAIIYFLCSILIIFIVSYLVCPSISDSCKGVTNFTIKLFAFTFLFVITFQLFNSTERFVETFNPKKFIRFLTRRNKEKK